MTTLQEPDVKLATILRHFREQCEQIGSGVSRWMNLPDWDGDENDLESIRDAFDRTAAGQAYAKSLTDAAAVPETTMAACMARMTEMAYLGMLERSFRMRHLSPSRAAAHAQSTRKAHGHQAGVHVGVVAKHIENLLQAAGQPR